MFTLRELLTRVAVSPMVFSLPRKWLGEESGSRERGGSIEETEYDDEKDKDPEEKTEEEDGGGEVMSGFWTR